LAWLDALVEESPTRTRSRLARYQEEASRGYRPHQLEMPPVEYGGYLLQYLMEVGPATSNGFGPGVISWQELQAWEHMTGVILTSWEATTLRMLSGHYVSQHAKSSDPMCPAPYVPEGVVFEEVDAKVTRIFDAIKRRKDKAA